MLSTEQQLNEGHYDPVDPPPASATDPVNERQSALTLTKFVGPESERPDLGDVMLWADQLLEAVHALHTKQQPIIHSGIAPSTVELDGENNLHLRTIREATPTGGSDPQVNYKPLEQIWDSLDHFSQRAILNRYTEEEQRWLSQQLTPASDIYSVGATLYAVLTGVVPVDVLDRSIASMEDKSDPLVNPTKLIPSIPAEISEVILKAMSVRRDDRYYSAVILRQVFKTAAVRIRERLAGVEPEAHVLAPRLEAPAPPQAAESTITTSAGEADKARQLARRILAEKAEPVDVPTSPQVPAVPAQTAPAKVMEAPAVYVSASPSPPEVAAAPQSVSDRLIENGAPGTDSVLFGGAIKDEGPGRSLKLPAMAAAALVIVLSLGIGIYKFTSSPTVVPTTDSSAADLLQPAAVPEPTAPAAASEVTAPEPPSTVNTTPETATPSKVTKPKDAAPVNVKKPAAPTAAKTPPPKKQLTVEDLLN